MSKADFRVDDGLGIVTLDAPPLNLIDTEMLDDLESCLEQAKRAQIRALWLRAEGECFSAGAQVVDMFQGRNAQESHGLLSRIAGTLGRFEQLPFPTLASAQGLCLTGGFEMALACDLLWVGESTQMGLVETSIGAIPFGGGIQRLAARAGAARAYEAVLGARIYDAATMERWHVVNRVVADADLDAKARAFAHKLAAGPTQAYAAVKRIMRAYLDEGIHSADQALPDIAASLFETEDMQAGITSMLERGPGQAAFHGR